ncbi:MAG: hypothetical protein P1U34_03295 [Coxiellaceae bacterium]|nr:hypothetical protein [Coxiellaceae bacterium]
MKKNILALGMLGLAALTLTTADSRTLAATTLSLLGFVAAEGLRRTMSFRNNRFGPGYDSTNSVAAVNQTLCVMPGTFALRERTGTFLASLNPAEKYRASCILSITNRMRAVAGEMMTSYPHVKFNTYKKAALTDPYLTNLMAETSHGHEVYYNLYPHGECCLWSPQTDWYMVCVIPEDLAKQSDPMKSILNDMKIAFEGSNTTMTEMCEKNYHTQRPS